MAEPVNLNKFRKAKKRAEKERRASENRIKHGRTRVEKDLERARAAKLDKATRDHKLSDTDNE